MDWALFEADGWKSHFVPHSLYTLLAQDAVERGHDRIESMTTAETAFTDRPGMVMTDRTIISFDLGGLVLNLPLADLSFFSSELESDRLRTFSNGIGYYKLHGWMTCVVLSEDQRDLLVAQLKTRAQELKDALAREDAEWERRMAVINRGGAKVLSGRSLEISAQKNFEAQKGKGLN